MKTVEIVEVPDDEFQSADEQSDSFHSPGPVSPRTDGSQSPTPSTTTVSNAIGPVEEAVNSLQSRDAGEAAQQNVLDAPDTTGIPTDAPVPDCEYAGTGDVTGTQDDGQCGSPQAHQAKAEAAEDCKRKGNEFFKQQQHAAAIEEYDKALAIAPADASERAIYFANKAACLLAISEDRGCIECCTAALKINPEYVKALRRRMTAHEKLDELEHALADAKQLVEKEPGDVKARHNVERWTPIVAERQEKMKEEVLGKLKDLGNSVLGRFGMSLDNFKMDQDPSTGGYSIRFEQ